MNKKYLILSIIIALVILISGFFIFAKYSDNKEFEENINTGLDAIEEQDYTKAEVYFELALDIKSDEKAKTYLEQTQNLEKALELQEESNIDEALIIFEEVSSQKDGIKELKEIADEQITIIHTFVEKTNAYNTQFTEIDNLISNKDYSGAINSLTLIANETKNAVGFESFYQKANELTTSTTTLLNEANEKKKAEEEAVRKKAEVEAQKQAEIKAFESKYSGNFTANSSTMFYLEPTNDGEIYWETVEEIDECSLYIEVKNNIASGSWSSNTGGSDFLIDVDSNGSKEIEPMLWDGSPADGDIELEFTNTEIIVYLYAGTWKSIIHFDITE